MDYQEAQEKLEKLLDGYKKRYIAKEQTGSTDLEELCMLYGELEEIISRFAGIEKVVVEPSSLHSSVYSNYIEATLYSGWAHYVHQGYTQLLKVIGKVRQHAKDPTIPKIEYSITNLIQILRRFRLDFGQILALTWHLNN
jgi:aromatic ring-opening dioxygenase LigB subunit